MQKQATFTSPSHAPTLTALRATLSVPSGCFLPTAARGGSFGGYMANWVAGQTDRFRAIVTHASLWALDQCGPTTDAAQYWLKEMTEDMAMDNSPHRHVERSARRCGHLR